MATTTNYGWTTPDDTALVKDGASAIRTLGTSVDTTTKNLNPETTLGDIAYRSSTSNVNTRLGIGSTGQVLTVASGVPSWANAGGGFSLISTTSFSAVSSFSAAANTFSATYDNYRILIHNIIPASGTITLQFRYRAAGTDNSSSNYYTQRFRALDAAGTATRDGGGTLYAIGFAGQGGSSSVAIDLINPFATKKSEILAFNNGFVSGDGASLQMTTGTIDVTTSFDSFSIIASASTITGVYSIYGYAK